VRVVHPKNRGLNSSHEGGLTYLNVHLTHTIPFILKIDDGMERKIVIITVTEKSLNIS
jgi:hypothetical protein